MKSTLRRAAVAGLALVAVVGALHLPAFRPLLATLAGCPFPTSSRVLTAGETEELRRRTFAPRGATARAASMPALGFALGKDDRATIARWTRDHGVACKADRHGAGLRCTDVRADALGAPGDGVGLLALGFDARGTLVSVQFSRSEADRERALALSEHAERSLARAGPPADERRSDLRAPLAQRHTLVALDDFRGEVTTTHMHRYYHVSQSYQTF